MSEPEVTYETWETTTGGGVWMLKVNNRGEERPYRVRGPAGHRFRITNRDREHSGARFYRPGQDPFLNGTFVRVDVPLEKVLEETPDYDVTQVFTNDDLLKVFASSGMAFQAKVRKLNERNTRRLAQLAQDNPELISAAQERFLTAHIMENYRPGGPPADPEG